MMLNMLPIVRGFVYFGATSRKAKMREMRRSPNNNKARLAKSERRHSKLKQHNKCQGQGSISNSKVISGKSVVKQNRDKEIKVIGRQDTSNSYFLYVS